MTTWFNLLAVAGGGAAGSVARYLIGLAAIAIPGGTSIIGTTVANLLGCAAIGAFSEYVLTHEGIGQRVWLMVQVGFLGGLTTFSTFAAESHGLVSAGRTPLAGLYVAANLLLGWGVLVAAASLVKGAMG